MRLAGSGPVQVPGAVQQIEQVAVGAERAQGQLGWLSTLARSLDGLGSRRQAARGGDVGDPVGQVSGRAAVLAGERRAGGEQRGQPSAEIQLPGAQVDEFIAPGGLDLNQCERGLQPGPVSVDAGDDGGAGRAVLDGRGQGGEVDGELTEGRAGRGGGLRAKARLARAQGGGASGRARLVAAGRPLIGTGRDLRRSSSASPRSLGLVRHRGPIGTGGDRLRRGFSRLSSGLALGGGERRGRASGHGHEFGRSGLRRGLTR
jgi:hypothetical protein